VNAKLRFGVVGDIHLSWDERDVADLDGAGYHCLLFVGDLAGYRRDATGVARLISRLSTPALVIPGNHDGVSIPHLAAETFERLRLARALGRDQARRCEALRRALAPVPLVGYSRHEVESEALGVTVIAARPHSQGGSFFAFSRYLEDRYGIGSFEASAARLRRLVDEAPHERLVFLAHNGPTGLGERRSDIWGCDFRREEGDFGDADLRDAITHAKQCGKRVLAVVAGHMHHRLKGGGRRTWRVERDGTLYVNSARVPRIDRRSEAGARYHVRLETDGDRATAELVEVTA
jgi:uncharacterized protein (TIGR04168 family)